MASSIASALQSGKSSTVPLSPSSTDEISQLKTSLQREKAAKRKMYSYLVKIADELKTLRTESEQLIHASEYARKAWYEGGMWRGPNVLPGASGIGSPSGGGSSARGDSDGVGGGASGGNEEEGMMAMGPALVPRAPVSLSDLFLGECCSHLYLSRFILCCQFNWHGHHFHFYNICATTNNFYFCNIFSPPSLY